MKPQAEPIRHYYRPYELARALDEDVSNIYRLIRSGMITYIYVGRKIKIPKLEFERILREGIGER
jgi:excisionase family DNA binding protein